MRFAPATLAASVALALACTGALAQNTLRVVPAGASGTNGSTVTATTNTGNTGTTTTTSAGTTATGTNGSTVTATTNGNAGSSSTGATTSVTTGDLATTSTAPSSSSVPTGPATSNAGASRQPIVTDVSSLPAEFVPQAAPTGAALGTSPGQTSSGTAAGNSGQGITAGSENLGTGNVAPGATGALQSGVVVPGAGFAAGGVVTDANAGTNAAAGSNVVGGVGAPARANTPIFDQVAREGLAKEQRRRARGDEPRVYGIAPRTERDLTRQMPDDPIIRY